jgi:hypothetical protein
MCLLQVTNCPIGLFVSIILHQIQVRYMIYEIKARELAGAIE